MAAELLDFYTPEQLRMHWLGLSLGQRSVSFQPKPLNPLAKEDENDPVTKEGFLLSNVFNRMVRTVFYDTQKYFDGVMPVGDPDGQIMEEARAAVLDYEHYMYTTEFHQVTYVLDSYIRKASKFMSKAKAEAEKADDINAVRRYLINAFHTIRTAVTLLHPFAPSGTEMVRDYMQLSDDIWDWDNIFMTLEQLCGDSHRLKFLEPRVDFFARHPSQFRQSGD